MKSVLKNKAVESDWIKQRNGQADKLLKVIQEKSVEFIDFRFTDTRGVWHHLSLHKAALSQDLLAKGIMFDGSSIDGWKNIDNSDMVLLPDAEYIVDDVFSEQPCLVVFCDIFEPNQVSGYLRDPRTIAGHAEEYLRQTGIADTAYFGPEPEFFIFEDVHYETTAQTSFYSINSTEGAYPGVPWFDYEDVRSRNTGHRPLSGKGYFPVPPVDSGMDIRAEMLSKLHQMGVKGEKSHHEVAIGQHELGFRHSNLLNTADQLQIYKYVVRNVAHQHGKTATFMPKPIYGDNGSGMHVHQSLWKDNTPLFLGNKYDNLSEEALYYIGGIIKHARALNAFTNPTTNSYKRLVKGFEAPIYKAYSACNRSAAVRIPHVTDPQAKRIEVRFPDATANPYLALTAMLMAGLDGIQSKIHPGDAMEKNLYEVNPNELNHDDLLCTSLQDALKELHEDRGFLKKGGVFTDDCIDSYINLKQEELTQFNEAPHPIEFKLYYSL